MTFQALPSASSVEALYLQHHRWLHAVLYRRSGCSELAADLAHDTFTRLLHRGDNVVAIREPRAFLGRIANGLLANHWRRKAIEQAYQETLLAQPEPVAISPETRYLIVETLYRVDRLLADLKPKVRKAFLLSRLDGLRYVEIARRLQVSERTVRNYMEQAMFHCLKAAPDLLP
ncbi:sigma-70 family RNA polymerase sigma factor [Alloalcanivorax sp. C16-2]|uniref:sigma-70 family RNA polymerase sigma factor n=1 Tax=Alloalcanivorax TaxID=3020832 RepID=UPI0019331AF0|nr:sigma-70 family RNA polymerase sigma factor [Alloalcanivorax marinus]MBL7250320.1 sigma-70 family RNA polymerase sigma factor [Alloalcanivorax marinus]